jgi:hypothetical protein
VSPRGSPPRLLDLRRGRGLVIVTGGPPCVSNAPLGGLNGGKGSILQLPRVSSICCRRVNPREGKVQLESTKNSSPPVPGDHQHRSECGGLPPTTNLGASPCRVLPTQFHMFHPVTSVSKIIHVIFDPLSASNAAVMPCLRSIPVLQSSLPRSHLFLFPS